MAKPYYLVFAGVNGAGKSTLFRTGLWQNGSFPNGLPRVNSDEIIVEHGWDWRSESDQFKAGKVAVRRMRGHLERRESFNQETTLSGHAAIHAIRSARDRGYHVVLFYVGLDDPAIANDRIAHRGCVGGHLVDPSAVARRYESSLSNLVSVLDVCDEAYLYDNTTILQLAACFARGEALYLAPEKLDTGWVPGVFAAYGYVELRL